MTYTHARARTRTHAQPDEEELMRRKMRGDEANVLEIPCTIAQLRHPVHFVGMFR